MKRASVLLRAEDVERIGFWGSYDFWAERGLEELRLRCMESLGLVNEMSPGHLGAARLRDYERRHRFTLADMERRAPERHAAHMDAVRAAIEAGGALPQIPRYR